MRVIVCGSRSWEDWLTIAERLGRLPAKSTVVHGGARGADEIAGRCAYRLGHTVEPHLADWETYKKKAGYVRNRRMIETAPDLVIAFWDGDSPGTRQMIGLAKRYSIPCEIILEDEELSR